MRIGAENPVIPAKQSEKRYQRSEFIEIAVHKYVQIRPSSSLLVSRFQPGLDDPPLTFDSCQADAQFRRYFRIGQLGEDF